MRNLVINRIKYIVKTHIGSNYGADVSFRKGLNIIYGPNTVGKSSLITGIIYCLGAEKGLGIFQSKQNPFKPEFYNSIDDEKIKQSHILLEISNGDKIVTLARSIIGKTDVVGVKECSIENFDTTPNVQYLIASGEGVFSDKGLQQYLFDFLGWDSVDVPSYDSSISKLYLENLISLFFVEQRAGWSQIQSRQIMRYGIRDVKKIAFEYIMGLDRFEAHIKELERKELVEKIVKLERELLDKEDYIMVLANARILDGVLLIERADTGKSSIYEVIRTLKNIRSDMVNMLQLVTDTNKKAGERENNLRDSLRVIGHQIRNTTNKINLLIAEISGYESYIQRIIINKTKNKQLKKIEGIALDINISICPVCENSLEDIRENHCNLCHHDLKRKISTPEENLDFLEDEKTSFEKVRDLKKMEVRKEKQKLETLKEREKTLMANIDHQIETYIGPEIDKYRKRITELDILSKEIELYERLAERWDNLKPIRQEISSLKKAEEILKNKIESYKQSKKDKQILDTILSNLKSNVEKMRLFKQNTGLIQDIKLDETDFYTPYLEKYDLYNIISSSDSIRVILSYYLSLLQTSILLPNMDNIRFPDLLILDEPRQQNLDNQDILEFINILKNLSQDKFQVILTTFSEASKDKKIFNDYIVKEMKNDKDFLLKRIED